MKQIFGFQVHINGKEVCRAGVEKANSVVTCILNSNRRARDASEELNMHVGGLNSVTRQNVTWFDGALRGNDTITITIIKDDFDEPSYRNEPVSEQDIIAGKLERYYKLKEELKDHLEE